MEGTYPDLHGEFDWPIGIHKSPVGYEHPWLAVMEERTLGAWTRTEAREIIKQAHHGQHAD